MISKSKRGALLRSTAAYALTSAALLAITSPAMAQSDGSGTRVNEGASTLDEIVVTARKRSEGILDVPLAITALPAAELAKKNIDSLDKVSAFTPALNVSSFGASISNRSQQTVIIRGTTPATQTNATTTVFLNGAPLGSAGLIDGIADVAQVEVIKGPQAAYFGRSTFGGAINMTTKKPGDEYGASIDVLYGSYNWMDLRATVEGPIIQDMLNFRLSARHYSIEGQYDNVAQPGHKFGEQSSQNISGELLFKPTDKLEIRAFAIHIRQDDGQSAMQKFRRRDLNCPISPGQIFLCGVAPELPLSNLSMNTTMPPGFLDWLRSQPTRYKDIGLDHFGVRVRNTIGNVIINYELPYGMQFTSVTAGSRVYADSITDLVNEYQTTQRLRYPFDTYNFNETFSQELRVTSDQSKRLRGSIGANYYYTHGGQTNMADSGSVGTFVAFAPGQLVLNRTKGVFGSLTYEITRELILNLEGRYQIDIGSGINRRAVNGQAEESKIPGLRYKEKQFLPRVIVQYKFRPGSQLYATYSEGVNPGIFNSAVLAQRPAVQELVFRQSGAGLSASPEALKNYEIGYKGTLFDGRLQLDIAAYQAHWTNQLISQTFYIQDPPLTGTPGVVTVAAYSNNGETKLKGIEGNVFFKVTDNLSVSAGGAINDSKIKRYTNVAAAALLGAPLPPPLELFAGNQLPNYSKYSATVSASYTRELNSELTGFANVDYIFKSGMYESAGNFVRSQNQNKVNVRLGVEKGDLRLEGFVENLFNDRSYASFTNSIDTIDNNLRIIYAALPMPRRVGVRVSSKF